MKSATIVIAAAVLLIVAIVTALVAFGGRSYEERTRKKDARSTATALAILGTPLPVAGLHPQALMFCEPIQQHPFGDAVRASNYPIATVPSGTVVLYKADTCEPDIDASGAVLVIAADGTSTRLQIVWADPVRAAFGPRPYEDVVWVPAQGHLNGSPAALTGSHLQALVELYAPTPPDSVVRIESGIQFHATAEGRILLGEIAERVQFVSLPLAVFVAGVPFRDARGAIARAQASATSDEIDVLELTVESAKYLAALATSDNLR